MKNGQKIRVGLVGAGYVSEFHIAALRPIANVEIAGIADLDIHRAEQVARQNGIECSTATLSELLVAGLDAVHILTPPASHTALAVEALEAGCHVLVEKPLATSVQDCLKIEKLAAVKNRKVCVNHSNLRDPFVAKALEVVRRGDVGDIVSVTYIRSSNYPPYMGGPLPPQYRDGGYPFRDMGVHGLYTIREFLGEIEDVSAYYSSRGTDPNLMFDEWTASVKCEKGFGQMAISWSVTPLQNRLIVQGTKGIIHADLFSMYITLRKRTHLPSSVERIWHGIYEALQVGCQVPWNVFRFVAKRIRRYHGLHETVAGFYAAIATDGPVPCPVSEAVPVVKWTEEVAQAADLEKHRRLERIDKPLMTAKTLVTGGTGFIGHHLVSRLLDEGNRVRLLTRRVPPVEWCNDDRIEIVVGDLGDPNLVNRAVEGVETVFHLGAAMGGPFHEFERSTVVGTRNIVNSVLRQQATKLVYVSSLSVLHAAAATQNDVIKEDWPLEPYPDSRGFYTKSKLEAENIVRAAVGDSQLRAVILRPGQVYGPGGPVLSPAVARKIGNRLIVLGDGKLPLPLVYVKDVVDGIVDADESGVEDGRVFHLVNDDETITQNEFLHQYQSVMGNESRIVHVPHACVTALSGGIALLAKILRRRPPLSPYRVKSALASLTYDCGAAKEQLGWMPKVGLTQGLESFSSTDVGSCNLSSSRGTKIRKSDAVGCP